MTIHPKNNSSSGKVRQNRFRTLFYWMLVVSFSLILQNITPLFSQELDSLSPATSYEQAEGNWQQLSNSDPDFSIGELASPWEPALEMLLRGEITPVNQDTERERTDPFQDDVLFEEVGRENENDVDWFLDQTVEVAPLATPMPVTQLEIAFETVSMTVRLKEVVPLTLNAKNSGEVALVDFQLAIFLPEGLQLAGTVDKGVETRYDDQYRLLTFSPAALNPGTVVSVTFQVEVTDAALPEISLKAVGGATYLAQVTEAYLEVHVEDAIAPSESMGVFSSSTEGGWTLRTNEPVVSTFSGAASYNYSLLLPPGRNGLQPSVSLSYNNKRVDGIISWQSSEWVGLGWNIDSMDIVRTGIREMWPGNPDFWLTYENRFQLIMNGTSYRLHPAVPGQMHGRYLAEDAPSLYITLINDCTDDDICDNNTGGSRVNRTTEYWLVKTPDGTTYRLGHDANSEQVLFRTGNREGWAPYSGPFYNHTAYRWRVDLVTDVYNNQMAYEYIKCRTGNPNCGLFTDVVHGQRENASYLHKIYYNKQGTSWLTTVEFVSVHQGNQSYTVNNGPVFATRRKLDSIKVWWQTTLVEEHILHYSPRYLPNSNLVLLLNRIEPFGLNGATAGNPLPGPTFGYEQFANKGVCHSFWGDPDPSVNPYGEPCKTNSPNHQWLREGFQYERLTWVENGYGGRTEFTYQNDGRAAYWGPWTNYYVSQKRVFDGINSGPVRTINYSYSEPCYDQWGSDYGPGGGVNCASPNPEGVGPLVGFKHATQTMSGSGGVLQVTGHAFHTNDIHYSLRGREHRTTSYAANGTTKLQEVRRIFGVNDGVCLTNGLPSAAIFTCLHRTETQLFDGVTGASRTTATEYQYLPGDQHGVQYGNRTRTFEFDENGNRQRISLTAYRANTNRWVIVPHINAIYDNGWNTEALAFFLYDGQTHPINQTIDRGRLTLKRELRTRIPSGICAGGTTYWIDTVDTSYTYHPTYIGNAKDSTTYAGYGRIGCANGAWTSFSAPGNSSTSYRSDIGYDSNGLFVTSASNPAGHTTTITYDNNFRWLPATVTDVPNNATTAFDYDRYGRLRKLAKPGDTLASPTVSYAYWDDPTLAGGVRFLSPLLISENYKNDILATKRTFYNGLGQIVQEQVAQAQLDGLGEQDIIVTTSYNALGQVACQTAPYPVVPHIGNGTSPFKNHNCQSYARTTSSYDALGRIVSTTNPHGETTTLTYRVPPGWSAIVGRGVWQVEVAAPSADGTNLELTYNAYDAFGRLSWVGQKNDGGWCNALHVTTYDYNTLGNLTKVERGSYVCGASYDGSKIVRTTMNYDALGRKISMNDRDMGEWSYAYDPAGNLKTQLDNKGQTLTYTYDSLGRLLTKLYGSQTLATYTYDDDEVPFSSGRLTHLSDPSGSHSWSYDNRGRIATESKSIIGGGSYQMSYTYDALDRLITITYPDGETVTNQYNRQGQPSSLTGTTSYITSATYNFMGQPKRLVRGNGLTTWYGYHGYQLFGLHDAYDAKNQSWNWPMPFGSLWRSCTAPNGSNICLADNKDLPVNDQLLDLRHSYHPGGNVRAVRDYTNSNQVQYFEYDTLNRLTRGYTTNVGEGRYDHRFEYDRIGNLTRRQEYLMGGSLQADYAYSYPYPNINNPARPHAVTAITAAGQPNQTFTYDVNGNMISRNDSTGNYAQTFDVENRLVQVTKTGQGSTLFTYDASGQRVKTVQPNGTVIYTPFPTYEEIWPLSPPTLNLTANGVSSLNLPPNTSFTLVWSSSGAQSCTASGSWSGSKAINGSQHISGFASGSRTYTLTCQNAAGSTAATVTVNITPLPTVTLTANGQTRLVLPPGSSFTLVWSSSGAQSCTASGAPQWSGSKPTSGSQQMTAPLFGSQQTYTLTCSNSSGSTSRSVIVTIGEAPPPCEGLFCIESLGNGATGLNTPDSGGQTPLIKRKTYTLGGQAIAIRISGDPTGGNNGLFYIHTDHLGSTSLMSYGQGHAANLVGKEFPGSRGRYLPYGGWRTEPTADLTDRAYTGQKHNMDIGLYYYNARYYAPGIGRFISADTLVPDPTNPQQFNRYTYVLNNPIVLVDPTGHFSESAIYGYLYAYECNLSHECASQLFQTWQSDEEWWAMLLEAEAGDVLFGSFSAGPGQGVVHFRFNGSGRDVLTGITYSDAKGNHVSNSFWGITLRDMFGSQTSKLYHGSPLSFSWGGLLRYLPGGGMPLLPYVRESNRTESFFTSEQVVWDDRFKNITASIAGGGIALNVCGGWCGVITGALLSQGTGEIMWYGWDEYGRQLNDRYWSVGGYNLTFRYYPNEGYRLIYYSGLNSGVVPFWPR